MSKLLESLTFSNPRTRAAFDDWPSGRVRVKCVFYTEHSNTKGWRVCRQTTDKNGEWCKPKMTTYGGPLAIVDGSDGRTYILQQQGGYPFITIHAHDFMNACDPVFRTDDRYEELLNIIKSTPKGT